MGEKRMILPSMGVPWGFLPLRRDTVKPAPPPDTADAILWLKDLSANYEYSLFAVTAAGLALAWAWLKFASARSG
jgi:hypothetical protein